MPTDKISAGLRFKEDMLLKITYIARQNLRSLNNQLEFITQKCIDEFEAENGEIVIPEEDRYNYRKWEKNIWQYKEISA